jgi:protein phosphatase
MNIIDFSKDVYSVTDVGLVRKANEDNCAYQETINGFLFVVCDGMGGHVGGAKASSIAVNSIVDFFSKEKYTNFKKALTDAITYANLEILYKVAENPELTGMGTTACIVLINDDQVWFAHVGDSRIYLYSNQKQQLYRLTKDHSIVQTLVDTGEITEADAERHPQRHRILKALGMKSVLQATVCEMPLLPANDDIILLCTDGLSCMVNDTVLQHTLEQNLSLQEKGDQMLKLAKQEGGIDNITIQLVNVSNSTHTISIFESKNNSSLLPIVNENIKNENIENENVKNENIENVCPKKKIGKKLWIIFLILGIVLLALGAFFVKKYLV